MQDKTGAYCPACMKGKLAERSLHDDWEGLLTCGNCGWREPRWDHDELCHFYSLGPCNCGAEKVRARGR